MNDHKEEGPQPEPGASNASNRGRDHVAAPIVTGAPDKDQGVRDAADLFDRLRDLNADPVELGGGQYLARCMHPGHEDANPSMSFTGGEDGRVLLNCFGCAPADRATWVRETFAAILGGVRKPPVDPARRKAATAAEDLGDPVATYSYTRDGEGGYRKLRYALPGGGKTFRWQHRDGGRWLPGLPAGVKGGDLDPYGWRVPPDGVRAVVVCEGEKDADRALAELPEDERDGAVCIHAEEGFDVASLPIGGLKIRVIADKDEVGRKKAARWLAAFPKAKVCEAAPDGRGADLSDHFDAGFGWDDLVEVTDSLRPVVEEEFNPRGWVDLDALLVDEDIDDEPDWLVPDVIVRDSDTTIASPGGVGKSLFAFEMAVALATGGEFLGRELDPAVVVYVDAEQPRHEVARRLRAIVGDADVDLGNLKYSLHGDWPDLDTEEGGQALVNAAKEFGAELIIVDTTSRFISGSENDNEVFHNLHKSFTKKSKAARIATVRLDHVGKDATKGPRGASSKTDGIDIEYVLRRPGKDDDDGTDKGIRHLVRTKNRFHLEGGESLVASMRREDGPLRHVLIGGPLLRTPTVLPADTDDKVAEAVANLERLGVPPDCSHREAKRLLAEDGVGVRNATLSAALKVYREAKTPSGVTDPVLAFPEGRPIDAPDGEHSPSRAPGTVGNEGGNTGEHLGNTSGNISGERAGEHLGEHLGEHPDPPVSLMDWVVDDE